MKSVNALQFFIMSEQAHLCSMVWSSCQKIVSCSGIRKIKSKAVALTVLQQFFVCAYFFTALWVLTKVDNIHEIDGFSEDLYIGGITFLLVTVSFPIAGWLADARYGRYKVTRFGLWLMWVASILAVTWLLVLDHLDDNELKSRIQTGGTLVLIITIPIGFALFAVNTVQFAVDQVPEASADEMSTLIHWSAWAVFLGQLTATITHILRFCIPSFSQRPHLSEAAQFMVPVTMLSFAIACDLVFHGWLTKDPVKQNPLRMITGVLQFAATHKHPLRHCAITYCAEKPSRIDFAKERYGGPYPNQQVEDVKTFFRMLVVMVMSTAFTVPLLLYLLSMMYLWSISANDQCSVRGKQLLYSPPTFAIVIIPLYEFLLYPLVRNRVPNMLLRMGIAAALSAFLSAALLTVGIVTFTQDPTSTSCVFKMSNSAILNPALGLKIPSSFFTAIVMVMYSTAITEFTYAQSPYNMRGLLMGLQLSIIFLTIPIAVSILVAWKIIKNDHRPTCDFYVLLFQFLCAVVGAILLCAVSVWYKWRQRETESNWSRVADRFYDRVLNNQIES